MRRAKVGWRDCKLIGAIEVHVVEIHQRVLTQRKDTVRCGPSDHQLKNEQGGASPMPGTS